MKNLPVTLDILLAQAASDHPARAALLDETGKSVSYYELAALSAGAAACLRDRVTVGAHVGILARNSTEAVAAYFAVFAAGGVVVWLNHTQEIGALASIAEDAELTLLIHDDAFAGRAEKILPSRHLPLAALIAARPDAAAQPSVRSGADLASIVYTSGSTDRPVGVMLSHRNLLANTASIVEYMGLTELDRAHCVLPFYYIYGLSILLSHIAVGGSVFLENRFLYPQTAVDSLDASGATGFAGVSTHYAVLLSQTDFASRVFPRLRYLAHAGDKMPAATALKLAELFPQKDLFLMYGQTEAAPRLAFLAPNKVTVKPGSAGRAIPGVRLRVVDDAGDECAPGVEGEIWASGANIMMGYWKRPEETARAVSEGWLRTGDLAYRDAEGDLFIVGRKKLFLKVGGHRVSPLEIESVTADFAGVAQAAVLGIPDPVLGQRIRIYLVETAPGAVNFEALAEFYRQRLPFYKMPSEVLLCSALPKNDQGKLDRKRLPQMSGELRPLREVV